MQLRPYQQKCVDDIIAFIHNDKGNGIVNLPCGSGKSIIAAKVAEHLHICQQRPIIVANRSKLLDQNASKLGVPHGLVSAGLKRAEYNAPIVVGGIQTIYNKAHKLGAAQWLIIDECHSVGNDFASDSMYHQFISHYQNARIIGLSATPFRSNEGQLSWGKIIHETIYQELWDAGFLVPLTNKLLDKPNLNDVAITAGEYNLGQLNSIMNVDDLVYRTAQKIIAYTADRNKVLIFCVTVEHAIHMAGILHSMGQKANFVHGGQTEENRYRNYNEFENGETKYLCNVELATIGVDFPCIDTIVILRPTMSLGLHEQILGRGVRLYPNKQDCLILDFAGNLAQHGNLGSPTWKWFGSKKVELKKNNTKICPKCETNVSVFYSECPSCQYIFLKETIPVEHNEDADMETNLNATNSEERWYKPSQIIYSRNMGKAGKLDTFKVHYLCGKADFYQFICFDHERGSWANKNALLWAKERGDIPESIDEALQICEGWKKPKTICVKPQKANPKYKEVCGFEW